MDTEVSAQLANLFVEHKNTISRYEEELASLKGLLDLCPLPMFVTTPDGSMHYVNHAYLDLINAVLSDVVGCGWLDFVHDDDRQTIIECWNLLIRGVESKFTGTVRYVKMDGTTIPSKLSFCRIFGGNYSGFVIQPAD